MLDRQHEVRVTGRLSDVAPAAVNPFSRVRPPFGS